MKLVSNHVHVKRPGKSGKKGLKRHGTLKGTVYRDTVYINLHIKFLIWEKTLGLRPDISEDPVNRGFTFTAVLQHRSSWHLREITIDKYFFDL